MKLASYPVRKMVTPEPKPQSDLLNRTCLLLLSQEQTKAGCGQTTCMFPNMKHVTNDAASSTELVHDSQDILVIVENIQMK